MKCINYIILILLFIHLFQNLHILLNQVFETLNQRLPLSTMCRSNRLAAPPTDNKTLVLALFFSLVNWRFSKERIIGIHIIYLYEDRIGIWLVASLHPILGFRWHQTNDTSSLSLWSLNRFCVHHAACFCKRFIDSQDKIFFLRTAQLEIGHRSVLTWWEIFEIYQDWPLRSLIWLVCSIHYITFPNLDVPRIAFMECFAHIYYIYIYIFFFLKYLIFIFAKIWTVR